MGSAVRTIHGIIWHDDLAWMEDMKGKRWTSHIHREQGRWKKAIEPLQDTIQILADELESESKTLHTMLFRAGSGQIEIGVAGSMTIQWKYKDEDLIRTATTLETDVKGDCVWTIEEVGDGAELYAVRMYKAAGKHIWEHIGVAPYLAIVGDRCYCLEAKKRLVYWRLVSWNAATGGDRRVHYEEDDYRYNLELIGSGSCAYLRRQDGTRQDAFIIQGGSEIRVLEGIVLDPRRFVFAAGRFEGYLVWESESGWVARGEAAKFRLPDFSKAVPEMLVREFLVTRWEGCRSLWRISKTKNPVLVWRGYGQIMFDPWESSWVRFVLPGKEAFWWKSDLPSHLPLPLPFVSDAAAVKAKSLDGTEIPFLLLAGQGSGKVGHKKGLLVIGYGAYGLAMPLMTQRWQPLLARGWSIAIGLWRGGGDHTPEWEDAGRVYGRKKVLEDAEAVVRAAQSIVKVGPAQTVLYGRSAGGLWVGGLAAKFPKGDLAGGAYMEVPYLDVLRTITNRNLPLTEIETDEFGLPEQRLSDFAGALEWSPMELLVCGKGIPGMWQIVRTGLNDSEVLAYESVKWIVRSKNPSAFLAVEGGQGHFVSGSRGFLQQAEDLAFILSKVDN